MKTHCLIGDHIAGNLIQFVNHDVVSLAFDSIKSFGGSRSSTGNSNEADEIPINVYYLGTCNLYFNFFEQIICF